MRETGPIKLNWKAAPVEVIRRWPGDVPLVVLGSGDGEYGGNWSRWTIVGRPIGDVQGTGDPLSALRGLDFKGRNAEVTEGAEERREGGEIPFQGGWIVCLKYELGAVIEPAAGHAATEKAALADARGSMVLVQACPSAYVHDGRDGSWWRVGKNDEREGLPEEAVLFARERQAEAVWSLTLEAESENDRRAYEQNVARTIEYIRAGDIFQANIARQIVGHFTGSARGFFAEALSRAKPWYGAYLESVNSVPGRQCRHAVISMSPELFLEYNAASRLVTTRPIKGTRPGDAHASELEHSEKDQAELTMIVDLMRNDLGRVCETGSVRVVESRSLERHAQGDAQQPGVLHGVATVQGRLRRALGITDLLHATFPGGSVTGAPKIRAMQIINELEPFQRDVYTGSIGYISASGNACFNIAIRTAEIEEKFSGLPDCSGTGVPPVSGVLTRPTQAGRLCHCSEALDHFQNALIRFGVGAGIVADSDPRAEYAETIDKAAVFRSLATDIFVRNTP